MRWALPTPIESCGYFWLAQSSCSSCVAKKPLRSVFDEEGADDEDHARPPFLIQGDDDRDEDEGHARAEANLNNDYVEAMAWNTAFLFVPSSHPSGSVRSADHADAPHSNGNDGDSDEDNVDDVVPRWTAFLDRHDTVDAGSADRDAKAEDDDAAYLNAFSFMDDKSGHVYNV